MREPQRRDAENAEGRRGFRMCVRVITWALS